MTCRKMILAWCALVLCASAVEAAGSPEEMDGGGGETQQASSYAYSSSGGDIDRSDDDGGAAEEHEEVEEETAGQEVGADAQGAGTRSKDIRLESLALARDAFSSGTSSTFGTRPYSGGYGGASSAQGGQGQGSPFGPDSPFGGSSFGSGQSGSSYSGSGQPDPSLALLPRGETSSPFAKGGSSQEGGGGGGYFGAGGEGVGSGESGAGNTGGGGFPGFGGGFSQGGPDTGSSSTKSGQFGGNFHRPATSQSGRKYPQGESLARYPQGGSIYHRGPLGHFFQGPPLAGFQGPTYTQGAQLFPQGHANVNSFHQLPGFPQSSPSRGAPQHREQQPLRSAQYPFGAPLTYTPLYRSVPLHAYAVSQR